MDTPLGKKYVDNVIQLIESDLGPPKKKSGRWLFWECPFHPDKHPSLGVSMVEGNWHCFQCGLGGDARTWLWKYRQVKTPQSQNRPISNFPIRSEKTITPPNEIWQSRARNYLDEWKDTLWWAQGKNARWHLYGRGLKGDIIEKFQLGYNPVDRFEPLEKWGLKPSSPDEKTVFIPAGICIPWIVDGKVWKINFRRGQAYPKYLQIKGSQPAIFGLESLKDHSTAFLVEGEFDAMLLGQEAGDLVRVCTLGSASSRHLSSQWQSYFLGCQRIFLVGDNDKAGRDWAETISGLSHRLKKVQLPTGKDISDYWLKGGNLHEWVQGIIGSGQ
jgi:DNA primase